MLRRELGRRVAILEETSAGTPEEQVDALWHEIIGELDEGERQLLRAVLSKTELRETWAEHSRAHWMAGATPSVAVIRAAAEVYREAAGFVRS